MYLLCPFNLLLLFSGFLSLSRFLHAHETWRAAYLKWYLVRMTIEHRGFLSISFCGFKKDNYRGNIAKDGQLTIWKHNLNFVEWKLYLHITQVTFISAHPRVTSVWTGSGHVITLYTTTTVTASFTIHAVCVNITPCNISWVHYRRKQEQLSMKLVDFILRFWQECDLYSQI